MIVISMDIFMDLKRHCSDNRRNGRNRVYTRHNLQSYTIKEYKKLARGGALPSLIGPTMTVAAGQENASNAKKHAKRQKKTVTHH
jgi:hypothetical protein